MTRRDFELIAHVLAFDLEHHCSTVESVDQLDRLARIFATELATTNPRFDRDRFLAACGLDI